MAKRNLNKGLAVTLSIFCGTASILTSSSSAMENSAVSPTKIQKLERQKQAMQDLLAFQKKCWQKTQEEPMSRPAMLTETNTHEEIIQELERHKQILERHKQIVDAQMRACNMYELEKFKELVNLEPKVHPKKPILTELTKIRNKLECEQKLSPPISLGGEQKPSPPISLGGEHIYRLGPGDEQIDEHMRLNQNLNAAFANALTMSETKVYIKGKERSKINLCIIKNLDEMINELKSNGGTITADQKKKMQIILLRYTRNLLNHLNYTERSTSIKSQAASKLIQDTNSLIDKYFDNKEEQNDRTFVKTILSDIYKSQNDKALSAFTEMLDNLIEEYCK